MNLGPISTSFHTARPVTMPTNASIAMKASWVALPKRFSPWIEAGVVVVHDANAKITYNVFDKRYRGKRSRFGKFIADLKSKGIDISDLDPADRPKEQEELALVMAKRPYEALGKRTVVINNATPNIARMATHATVKKDELFDWNNPAVKHSKYYKMAARILQENDPEVAVKIVNIITGYA